jgi:ATP-binding cassette subfamily C (CFTR/MRP) protein 1
MLVRPGFGFSNAEYVSSNEPDDAVPPTRDESDYSLISSLNPIFGQLNPLLRLGYSRPLRNGDLGTLPPDARMESLVPVFREALEAEKQLPSEQRSLWRVLVNTMGSFDVLKSILLGFIGSACTFVSPLLLKSISNHLTGQKSLPGGDGIMWLLVGLVFVVPSVGSITSCHSTMQLNYFGIKTRNVLTSVVFDKIFKLRGTSLESGEVVNIINVDIKALELIFSSIGPSIIVPFVILCDLLLIYWQIGVAALVGLSWCLFSIPLSMYLIKTVGAQFKNRLKIGDKRLKHINEIFQGIRVIKYFAWETAFIAKIEALRDQEQVIAKYTARLTSLALYLQQSFPAWIPIIIFSTYIGLGHELDAVQAFVVLQLIMLLSGPLNKLIAVGNAVSMAMASSTRVSNFLFKEEIAAYVNVDLSGLQSSINARTSDGESQPTVICFRNACLGWQAERAAISNSMEVSLHNGMAVESPLVANSKSKSKAFGGSGYEMVNIKDESTHAKLATSDEITVSKDDNTAIDEDSEDAVVNRSIYTIRGVNLTVKKGQLIAIIGSIGSGKSSLLSSLLNELYLHDGSVSIRGSIAYHQQNAWIFNSTLKNNIIFGHEFDQEKFDTVVQAASLMADVESLSHGWDTEIGEKGINLSGGQKARISFCRALYADADVYLLDDPLSAVDAHVGCTMFYDGIKGALAGKTVLLATHQTQYLKDCDLIVMMADGQVTGVDTYANFMSRGIDVEAFEGSKSTSGTAAPQSLATVHNSNANKSEDIVKEPALLAPVPMRAPKVASLNALRASRNSSTSPASPSGLAARSPADKAKGTPQGGLMSAEHKAKGRIRWGTYWFYISRGRPEIYVLMISVVLASQVLSTYANVWLSSWGEASSAGALSKSQNYYYLNRYTLLALAGSCTGLINMNLNVEHRTKAAKYIHKELLSKVLSASVAFFDTTPLGRIMNVFSNDIRTMDLQIGMTMAQFIVTGGALLGTTGILAYTTTGTFVFVLIPLFLLYSYFQSYYQKSNLELKRLDSIANSPIVSQFTEVLSGITSVRAYAGRDRYFDRMDRAVIKESTIFYLQQLLDNWKQVRLDMSGTFMSLFVYILAASTRNFISPRLLLVAVTYSNVLPLQCSNMVTILSTVESSFNSVERIMHYVEEVKSEEPFTFREDNDSTTSVDADKEVLRGWPSVGEVHLENIVVGYRDGPDVLRNVSADIRSKEKVGVVGRSGSGKSTLMLSLFRFENLRR